MPQDGTTVLGAPAQASDIDGRAAWLRMAAALVLSTLGSTGMWFVVVALPFVQPDFGATRSEASLPYTLAMLGFGLGGILLGRLSDRLGVLKAILVGISCIVSGYILAGLSQTLWQYALAYGVLIGVGTSAVFAPLMADISHWFRRRRGIAVSIVACGNYLSGTIWPPILQHFIATEGWRATHIGFGIVCLAGMLPLALAFRRRAPSDGHGDAVATWQPQPMALSPATLQVLLFIAGIACCVAMSMPQVHIVAYCGDLGYGPARGAEMLALMLGMGVISRLASGLIADRIGGLATLLMGSALQGVALLLYLPFDGLVSLYIVSALFGLFQGGIVPMYALIVREYFAPQEAGTRVGLVIMATLLGMAFGGWVSGVIFDVTGSYQAAFINGIAWNLVNVSVVTFLLWNGRRHRRARSGAPAAA